MLVINERYSIPDEELEWSFTRSGGPGGQNVNKVSSRAVLRWKLAENTSLPEEARMRLRGLERRRITTRGDLLLTSQRFRDQERNRTDCLDRLREMVLRALIVPKLRKPTRPTQGSKRRRLADKRHRAQRKQGRQGFPEE